MSEYTADTMTPDEVIEFVVKRPQLYGLVRVPSREQIEQALWTFPLNVISLKELREKAESEPDNYRETLDYLRLQADAVQALLKGNENE